MAANLVDAIRLAVEYHGNTLEKSQREPYILHPLRVMLAQETEFGRMVGVLHDTIEDTALTMEQLQSQGFPPEVLEALRLVTHNDGSPYDDYIERLKMNPLARKVKIADLEDNMNVRRLNEISEAAVARLHKYLRVWRMLKEIDLAQEMGG
jgi:(p)ppGpp synthase/HD superfamily hydrolase